MHTYIHIHIYAHTHTHTCKAYIQGNLRMFAGKMQHDAAADGAAHGNGPVERKGICYGKHHTHIGVRRKPVCFLMPAFGGRGLAMPGHVEGDDPKPLGDLLIVHQRPVLAPVRTGGMKTKKRNALPGLFEINPVRTAFQLEIEIAAYDRFHQSFHWPFSSRRSAKTLLK